MTKELAREYYRGFEMDPELFVDMSKFRPYEYSAEKCVEIVDTDAENGAASIFGEGSLALIVAFLSLIASGVAIFLVVYYNKKKAAPVAANGVAETETDDEE